MDRPLRPGPRRPAGGRGRHRAGARHPVPQRGPQAHRHPAAVDRRRLLLRHRRPAGLHGQPRRPHRPQEAAAHRRHRLRPGLGPQRLRHLARADDRGPRPARCRRCHPDALHAGADPQHLPRRPRTQRRHRHLGRGRLGRRRRRPGRRRVPAGALLVGLGLPHQPAGDGRPGGRRRQAAPRVEEPRPRPVGPGQRRPLADRHHRRRLRDQGRRGARRLVGRRRGRRGRFRHPGLVRPPPADPEVAAAGHAPLPQPGLLGGGPRRPADHPGPRRPGLLPLPVPPARPGQAAAGGRARRTPGRDRRRRRRSPRGPGRAPLLGAGGGLRRPRRDRSGAGGHHPGRPEHGLPAARRDPAGGRRRRGPRLHRDRRRDPLLRAQGAGRFGLGRLGDRLRTGRRPRHRPARLHRHRRLPRLPGPRGDAGPGRRRRPRVAGGAVEAASALPGQTGAELVAAAQRAFVDGLHTASSIGCVVLVATAVAAWFLLRGQRLEDGAGAHH